MISKGLLFGFLALQNMVGGRNRLGGGRGRYSYMTPEQVQKAKETRERARLANAKRDPSRQELREYFRRTEFGKNTGYSNLVGRANRRMRRAVSRNNAKLAFLKLRRESS